MTLLAGLATLGAVSACGTGQYAQTANQVPGVPGTNLNAGPNGTIQFRNVVVQYSNPNGYPAGGSAPLVVRIFNDGQDAVTLTSVEAPGYASEVLLTTGSATPIPTPAASPTTVAPTVAPTGTPSGTPKPTGSAAPTATPTAVPTTAAPTTPPAPGSTFPVTIQPGTWADLIPGQGPYLLLTSLTKPIIPGGNVVVTFHFGDGTTATLPIPVDLPEGGAGRGSAQPGIGAPQQ
jgi:hypothetical protein